MIAVANFPTNTLRADVTLNKAGTFTVPVAVSGNGLTRRRDHQRDHGERMRTGSGCYQENSEKTDLGTNPGSAFATKNRRACSAYIGPPPLRNAAPQDVILYDVFTRPLGCLVMPTLASILVMSHFGTSACTRTAAFRYRCWELGLCSRICRSLSCRFASFVLMTTGTWPTPKLNFSGLSGLKRGHVTMGNLLSLRLRTSYPVCACST